MAQDTKNISDLSFEDAMAELESIVRNMESGDTKLEDSISAYERGIELKKHCEKKLRDAQSKIEKITINDDGAATAEPFDQEE
ncbi:MAG: exodeoxyribonuclease VII small subunit [Alphaproteobacteria bacterium]|jgi:exodeoxyribonuclease VII small subunit|nr:exodeoxyribonuclease VII small subunit [Alphaproteobacteria bacterium]MDP7222911.1 exodeoxyribonuclease VII small subunit [Alphaproteobacteria bacterium]